MLYFQVIVHHRGKSGKEFKQKLEQKQWSNAYSLALSYSLIQINLTAQECFCVQCVYPLTSISNKDFNLQESTEANLIQEIPQSKFPCPHNSNWCHLSISLNSTNIFGVSMIPYFFGFVFVGFFFFSFQASLFTGES